MRLSTLLALPTALASVVWASVPDATHRYNEQLHLKPLPGGALYAGFNFTASTPISAYESLHFRYFPRSLGQILHFTRTAELHLRFALGRWDEKTWGRRPRGGTREGGTGVELWAWIQANTSTEAEQRWDDLVNSLSGLFCASLNFIDQTKTTRPVLTFEPEGDLGRNSSTAHLMHGMLPHEVVCTENLTPFLKLLPCKGKAGVSSLLDGHKVFDADWQTMAIDVRSVGHAHGDHSLEISQTVDMVLDLERSTRPRDDPIPRPPPVESINCDESKIYNAHDTCFPKKRVGTVDWSISEIFGRPIQGSCPAGDDAAGGDIILESSEDTQILTAAVEVPSAHDSDLFTRQYRLPEAQECDMRISHSVVDAVKNESSRLRASRQMTGYGQERGGMHAVISNPLPQAQRIVYMESLPWFLRPYMHTLSITGATVDKMYYTPARDRQKGTQLELSLSIPALSSVDLKYDFEKAILRYTEYPPDANRGFDVAPAIIRVLASEENGGEQNHYLRTTSLLLPLPTPDFSMPYNVIILTSTVIALGFGSIFNLLTRRFVLTKEVPTPRLAVFLKKLRGRLGRRTNAKGGQDDRVSQEPDADVANGGLVPEAVANGRKLEQVDQLSAGQRADSMTKRTKGGGRGLHLDVNE